MRFIVIGEFVFCMLRIIPGSFIHVFLLRDVFAPSASGSRSGFPRLLYFSVYDTGLYCLLYFSFHLGYDVALSHFHVVV